MLEITGALQGARALAQAAKLAVEARDDAKIKEAVLALQEKLFDAMSAAVETVEKHAALQAQLLQLQGEKAEIERQLKERDMYGLHELVPGRFALAPKPSLNGDNQPKYYLCQACRSKGLDTILRYNKAYDYVPSGWYCIENNAHTIYD